jgi:hypothetical protein
MKRTRLADEQIIGILKETEANEKTGDLERRRGITVRPHGSMCYRLLAPETAAQRSGEAAVFTASKHCKRVCASL